MTVAATGAAGQRDDRVDHLGAVEQTRIVVVRPGTATTSTGPPAASATARLCSGGTTVSAVP